MSLSEPLTRTIVLWCPDWPVVAAMQATGLDAELPVALVENGLVFACSPAARREGVRRGLKLREAQFRCAELLLLPYDPVHDGRAFEPVVARIEQLVPGVQLLQPGTCAIRARGPARYYGGEQQAAEALLRCLEQLGVPDARAGVADGPFAAEHAARSAGHRPGSAHVRIVPSGESSAFLAPLPLDILLDERHATLLHRLGVHVLGDFAALPAADVQRRFGAEGAHAHAIAGGHDGRTVTARTPPKDFDAVAVFEPALDRIDQVTFGFRTSADEFIEALTRSRLVCTTVRVEVRTESGESSERSWRHPHWFTAADVIDRVRWQLQGSGSTERSLGSGVTQVRVSPERVDSTGNHEAGLWGSGPDERVHHGLTRVQSMLGHEAVVTAVVGGGRMLAERQIHVPWGDEPPREAMVLAESRPWPGSLPALAPATVFQERHTVGLLDDRGKPIEVDERGTLSGTPAVLSPTGEQDEHRRLRAWAGPWPVVERWWDPTSARLLSRFQVVDDDGIAWLLVCERGGGAGETPDAGIRQWWAEARYD
ncbi:Y-family DNA polymerase [Luethyella okanaganae]|uniref:DNA polymerase Y family protein n=1 Tax=Luethyella okanaganae TaxID=69372 RepID=A0ABW1VFZ8_9MICO